MASVRIHSDFRGAVVEVEISEDYLTIAQTARDVLPPLLDEAVKRTKAAHGIS